MLRAKHFKSIALTLLLVFMVCSVAFAGAPNKVYYTTEDNNVVQVDYTAAKAQKADGNSTLYDAFKAYVTQALLALKGVTVEDTEGKYIDWTLAFTNMTDWSTASGDATYQVAQPNATQQLTLIDGAAIITDIVSDELSVQTVGTINDGMFTVTFNSAPTESLDGKVITLTNGAVTATATFVSLEGVVANFEIASTVGMVTGDYTVSADWATIPAGTITNFIAQQDSTLTVAASTHEVVVSPDGSTPPVEITVTLNNFGENVEASLSFDSTWGQIAETQTTTDGVAVVKLYPDTNSEELTAVVTVKVLKAQNVVTGAIIDDLLNTPAQTVSIVFKPEQVSTGDGKVYSITGGLTDQADRVYVNLNQDLSADAEELLLAHPGWFTVFDDINGVDLPIQVSKVVKKDSDTLVLVLNSADENFPLTDNATHAVEINDNDANNGIIYFNGYDDFILEDSSYVKLMKVTTQKEDSTLDYNQIKVVFSEAVNASDVTDGERAYKNSVKNLYNWVINGLNLKEDLPSGDTDNVTVDVISTKESTVERETVILTFDDIDDIREFLVGNTHRLQVNTLGDWASVTDSLNIVATQELEYKGIELQKVQLDWYIDGDQAGDADGVNESPEQFVVDFTGPVFDKNKDGIYDNFEIIIPTSNLTDPYGDNAYDVLTEANGDFTVSTLEAGRKYLIEMNQDWTEYYNTQDTEFNYHISRYNPIRLVARDLVDGLGDDIKDTDALNAVKTAPNDLRLYEDTFSPYTVTKVQLTGVKLLDESGIIGQTEEGNLENLNISDAGAVYIEMNEPVQFKDQNGTWTSPITPSQQQWLWFGGIPVGTFEYVKQLNSDGTAVVDNVTIEGEITRLAQGTNGQEEERDYAVVVEPLSELSDGQWKLVVRSLSDDVGNTMATEEMLVAISTYEEGPGEPTGLQVEAIDAHYQVVNDTADNDMYNGHDWLSDETYPEDLNNTDDAKDIIHILFNQEMALTGEKSVLNKANYRINGEALPEGTTQIVRGIKGENGLETVKTAVTIILPDGYLQERNINHILTIINVSNAAGTEYINERLELPYSHMHETMPVSGSLISSDNANGTANVTLTVNNAYGAGLEGLSADEIAFNYLTADQDGIFWNDVLSEWSLIYEDFTDQGDGTYTLLFNTNNWTAFNNSDVQVYVQGYDNDIAQGNISVSGLIPSFVPGAGRTK